MEIIIQNLFFTPSLELNEFVTNKINKLDRFHKRIEQANVCLKLESNIGDNKMCEIRLAVPGMDLFAKRRSGTFEEAIAQTVEALMKQMKRIKIRSYT